MLCRRMLDTKRRNSETMRRCERSARCVSRKFFIFSFSCTGTFESTKTSFIARKQWIRKIDNRTEKKISPNFSHWKDADKAARFCKKLFVTFVLSRRYFKCSVFRSVLSRSVKILLQNKRREKSGEQEDFFFLLPSHRESVSVKNFPHCTILRFLKRI